MTNYNYHFVSVFESDNAKFSAELERLFNQGFFVVGNGIGTCLELTSWFPPKFTRYYYAFMEKTSKIEKEVGEDDIIIDGKSPDSL